MRVMWRMTHGEYRANLNGLNIFFGAVLGFVMAGTETLRPADYAVTLTICAGVVISILYVSSSPYRIAYALLTAAMIAGLPYLLDPVLHDGAQVPRNLQPTLAVWLGLTLFVELIPREKPARDAGEPDDDA